MLSQQRKWERVKELGFPPIAKSKRDNCQTRTSWVNRAEPKWKGELGRQIKKIVGAKETRGKKWNWGRRKRWQAEIQIEILENKKQREKETKELGEQEEGSRKFLRHFPDPFVLLKKLKYDNTPPPFLSLMPLLLHSFLSLSLSSCMFVFMWACSRRWWLDFKSSGSCSAHSSVLLQRTRSRQRVRGHDPENSSYLMSSSRSHSVWCLKCSLVICSVCVFFSSWVTLTWGNWKSLSFIHPSALQTCHLFSNPERTQHWN